MTNAISIFKDFEDSLCSSKINFLNTIATTYGKNKYKMYLGSPIRYAGGKSRAVGLIVEMIPDDIKKLVSPFMGGGSVEVAAATGLGIEVKGYDVFDVLVNYWNVQIKEPEALYQQLLNFKPTEEVFKEINTTLKRHWTGEEKLNELDLASHYFFNHNLGFGPKFLGYPSVGRLNEKRYTAMLKKVRNFRAQKLDVELLPFDKSIPLHNNDFMYIDPPYFLGGDSKVSGGFYPSSDFPIHHNNFNHELLKDLLLEHRGGFILSYNDCSQIREWYKDFEMTLPEWYNSFSDNRKPGKEYHELIFYKPPTKAND